ncbi:MAG: chorismate synthase [Treponema sp.]|jgi:chorismate synthase|nr:chorismate synthase [Treponema sp.]
MSSNIGNKLKVQLFGQSHSRAVGVVMDGLPAGEKIDMERVAAFLRRRAGGKNSWSTPRTEPDVPNIVSGLVDDVTCGAPLCALFENTNTRGGDYEELRAVPRPSHADYTAFVKHSAHNDVNGGGHFSARLTLPLCFAGAVCLQLLERKGVAIDAHIRSIGDIVDEPLNTLCANDAPVDHNFPVLSPPAGEKMVSAIEAAAAEGDSLGGIVECGVWGLPAGLGEPMFDNLESRLAYALFAIPAVKGVEFGAGFGAAKMRGSEHNDPFYMDNGKVRTKTNNSGGILGGISSGMPVIFRAAFKPTPSISKAQKSVNLLTGEDVTLNIKGRHDPCVVPRAVPCVIAAAAIVILDIILGG